MANEITIIIKNGNVGSQDAIKEVESSGNKGTKPQIDSVEHKPVEQSNNKNISKMISMGVLTAQANKILANSLQNYVTISGKTTFGKNIDSAKQIIGYAGTIAVGGWAGAIAVATDISLKIANEVIDQRQKEYDRQRLIRRNGSITTSGSRGGFDYD